MGIMLKLSFLLVVGFLLSACATSLKPQDLANVKTVGVINSFPETPHYIVVGTTVFNNEYDKINEPTYKALLEKTVLDRLSAKGFQASIIRKEQSDQFDMILEIVPRDVYETPETDGYGINQNSILGVRMPAFSYISLNIAPTIHGNMMCAAYYVAKITSLKIGDMPSSWQDLSPQYQDQAKKSLNDNIVSGINEVMLKMGL
jgi:hypothetical protein